MIITEVTAEVKQKTEAEFKEEKLIEFERKLHELMPFCSYFISPAQMRQGINNLLELSKRERNFVISEEDFLKKYIVLNLDPNKPELTKEFKGLKMTAYESNLKFKKRKSLDNQLQRDERELNSEEYKNFTNQENY